LGIFNKEVGVSDISKKILSIDPDENGSDSETQPRPGSETSGKEAFPAFVHRPSQTFVSDGDETKSGRWVIWTGVLLALLWIGLSAAYLYTQPLEGVGLFTPIGLTISGLVILFPGLVLLLFCIASYKLSRMSAKAARLSDICERLLKADQSSAHQATNLAEAIRGQMNRLNNEMSTLTERFETTRQSAQAHSKTLNETSASLLSANETLERSLKEQRTALESMLKTAEEKFQQTEEKLEKQKTSLSDTLDRTALSLGEAGQKLEDKSHAFNQFISESETRLSSMTEKLSTTKQQADAIGEGLETHITALAEKVSALHTENIRLSESLENRLPLLSSLSDSAEVAQEALFGVISKSVDATDALRSEAKLVGDLLSEKFQTLNDELSETKASTQTIIDQGEKSGRNTLESAQKALSDLETRLERLGEKSSEIETRQMTAPYSQDEDSQTPPPSPSKLVGNRLHLRPLEDAPSSLPAGSKPYDLQIEPLDLETDMSIPAPEQNISTHSSSASDVVKPLSSSAPLFGRTKAKEKSPWRWRDMMGGFDNPSHDIEPEENVKVESETTPNQRTTLKTFDQWIHEIGLNPDKSINDGTVLEAANALATGSESLAAVIWQRIPDIASEIEAAAQEYDGVPESAHRHREHVSETINPEIMNREALRNRLNTMDGKLYLLSWLV